MEYNVRAKFFFPSEAIESMEPSIVEAHFPAKAVIGIWQTFILF